MNVLEYGKAFYKIKRYDILHSFRKQPLQFDEQVKSVTKTLREKGYVVLESYFSDEQCEMARQEIDRVLSEKTTLVQTDKHDSDHRLFGANNASTFIDSVTNCVVKTYPALYI